MPSFALKYFNVYFIAKSFKPEYHADIWDIFLHKKILVLCSSKEKLRHLYHFCKNKSSGDTTKVFKNVEAFSHYLSHSLIHQKHFVQIYFAFLKILTNNARRWLKFWHEHQDDEIKLWCFEIKKKKQLSNLFQITVIIFLLKIIRI